nr:MAG TPA: shock protein B [Caudoviricetes sp.]
MLAQEYATNPYLKGLPVLGVLSVAIATYLAWYMTYTGDTGNELIVGSLVLFVLGVTAICCFFALRRSDKTSWIWKERAHRERAKAQKLQNDVSRLEREVANLSKSTNHSETPDYKETAPPILDFHRIDYAQGSLISHLHQAYRSGERDLRLRGLYTEALAALLHCRQDEVTLATCAREIYEWGNLLSSVVGTASTAHKCLTHAMLFVGAQTRVEREREYQTLHKLLLDTLSAD